MIFLYSLALGVLLGYALRGRLSGLTALQLRGLWLVLVSLAIQLLIFPLFASEPIVPYGTAVLHGISYGLVVLWLILNLRIRPLLAIGAGAVLNLAVVLANGGFIPASAGALRGSGLHGVAEIVARGQTYGNLVLMDSTTRLNFLGDVIPLPSWLPFAAAISAGDVLIMAGIVWLVAAGMRSRRG